MFIQTGICICKNTYNNITIPLHSLFLFDDDDDVLKNSLSGGDICMSIEWFPIN